MTLSLFIILVTILSLASSFLTQGIKKAFTVKKPTLLVAIISAIAGFGGGALTYVLMGIAFNPVNIVCLALLAPAIWLSATLGYDKTMEIIRQIAAAASGANDKL